MAYKLVCTQEFHDDISGQMINRGDEIVDYTHLAKLVAANREHHFVKVWLAMADGQWEWPPRLPVETPVATPQTGPSAAAAAAKAGYTAAEAEETVAKAE
jgi:hypothetical protein